MRVHVVYEHSGSDLRPFGSSHLRLLRPLSHPMAGIDATFGPDAPDPHARIDIVIVDRLWRPGTSALDAQALVAGQQNLGRRVIYALDDDFEEVDQVARDGDRAPGVVAAAFATAADGLLVTTPRLAAKCGRWNARVQVLPHALDERLLARRRPAPRHTPFGNRPLVVGVMGTRTHDGDLAVIREVVDRLASCSDIRFALCGATADPDSWRAAGVEPVRPASGEEEYPLFMTWWSESVTWDVGLAPLAPTAFNCAKSDVKLLDYGSVGAAGVFSAGEAYDSSVREGENGLLVDGSPDSWVAAITLLEANDEMRMSIAREACDELWSDRILARRAGDWAAALEALAGGAPESV